jgi:hypothetical protein
MAFFKFLGNVWVNQPDGSTILMNDLTAFADITDAWRKDATVQIPYTVRDGELPHMISYRLYGSVEYWWTILMMNNIYDFDNQWPRSYEQLNDYIAVKYPNSNPVTDVHHYVNGDGMVADLLSTRIALGVTDDSQAIDLGGLEPITIQDFEFGLNEQKRNIKLVDPDFISTVQTQFEAAMQGA